MQNNFTKNQSNIKKKTKRFRLCPSCKEKKMKIRGVKDECPLQKDVYSKIVICWCCEECRNVCRDSI